ncbi:hypothetical protein UC34_06625 [Pandoraea vervacti]|uniref:Uncharacterized protein n=1 Tax=Pandoraea vervacti TaxID=656178 RepID=A0ABN4FQ44_9BURK|nr:hypothetical protein [Pandoraea vervacti]AJP56747.1 hypothetical protein UC34_06625 [Pandoraea vervacti]
MKAEPIMSPTTALPACPPHGAQAAPQTDPPSPVAAIPSISSTMRGDLDLVRAATPDTSSGNVLSHLAYRLSSITRLGARVSRAPDGEMQRARERGDAILRSQVPNAALDPDANGIAPADVIRHRLLGLVDLPDQARHDAWVASAYQSCDSNGAISPDLLGPYVDALAGLPDAQRASAAKFAIGCLQKWHLANGQSACLGDKIGTVLRGMKNDTSAGAFASALREHANLYFEGKQHLVAWGICDGVAHFAPDAAARIIAATTLWTLPHRHLRYRPGPWHSALNALKDGLKPDALPGASELVPHANAIVHLPSAAPSAQWKAAEAFADYLLTVARSAGASQPADAYLQNVLSALDDLNLRGFVTAALFTRSRDASDDMHAPVRTAFQSLREQFNPAYGLLLDDMLSLESSPPLSIEG